MQAHRSLTTHGERSVQENGLEVGSVARWEGSAMKTSNMSPVVAHDGGA
jgi:hypothetical protein